MVTRADVPAYASKYLKAGDLAGPTIATIKVAALEELKGFDGKADQKVVLYFTKKLKRLPLNITNYNSCCDILGEETDEWTNGKIELVPSTVSMNGKVHDCIRIRKPGAAAKPKVMKPEPDPDMNDDLPEFA
jgi:hypothetical protein